MEKDKSSIFNRSLKARREPAHVMPLPGGQACPRKALENLMTTLDRPFLTPGWLGPTHLSLPLHFSFSLRKKTKNFRPHVQ